MNHLPSLDKLFQFDPDLNDELYCDRIRLKSQQFFAQNAPLSRAEGHPQQSAATTSYKCLSIMVIYSIKRSVQTSGDVMIILKRPFGLPIDEPSAFFR